MAEELPWVCCHHTQHRAHRSCSHWLQLSISATTLRLLQQLRASLQEAGPFLPGLLHNKAPHHDTKQAVKMNRKRSRMILEKVVRVSDKLL